MFATPSPWRNFPTFHTPRLTLRRIEFGDIHEVFAALSNPKITRYYAVHYDTLEDTEAQMDWFETIWREQTGMWWAICLEGQKKLIGACGFNHYQAEQAQSEIGYWLLPPYHSKGYASEALQPMVQYGFDHLKLHRVEAWVERGNKASEKLLQRLDFEKEKTLENWEEKEGQLIDIHVFVRTH